MKTMMVIVLGLLGLGLAACGDDDSGPDDYGGSSGNRGDSDNGRDGGDGADVEVGDTVIVAIINPVINDGHKGGTPAEHGADRNGITVDAEPGESAVSADNGLAIVDVPAGNITLGVGPASIGHTVQAEGDVYDAPIAFNGTEASFFANTPIRYPVGRDFEKVIFNPDDGLEDINAGLAEDDVIVVLSPGSYPGSIDIRGKGVLLFGQGWSENAVTIDGDLVANGEEIRLRGLTITGDLTSNGNNFGISFSVVHGRTTIKGNGGVFVRNVFCGDATVPSSNSTLLDNWGVAPLDEKHPGLCP